MSPATKTILICDDDQGMRDTLTAILKRDYRVLTVSSGEAALALLKNEDIDLILQDIRLPGISGFDVLRIVKENYSLVECIMISAINEVETAVQAMKHGAYHYITKDFDYDELRSLVRNACERQDLNRQVITLSAQVAEQSEREFIIGPSRQIRDIVDLVQRVAKLSATVLILGESGTGKELLARLLHKESGRGDAPFIAVNMSAIPHELVESTLFGHERGSFTGAVKQQLGKFELAAGGTLFLDEIGDLRFDLQAKLLRAIQEGGIERVGGTKPIKTDFRLIAATNIDLERAVKEGRFREDLYYRINVVGIAVPPLRARTNDVLLLAQFFLKRAAARNRKAVIGLSGPAARLLVNYDWPGNVRELENCVERAVALCRLEEITIDDLPPKIRQYNNSNLVVAAESPSELITLDEMERRYVRHVLERVGGNKTRAAKALGIDRRSLYRRLETLHEQQAAEQNGGEPTNGQNTDEGPTQ
jgi:two-component system response regulator AtoC